jgi:hypothetical protein
VLEARCIFAAGSRKNGTWDPNYFKFFRTPAQVREKVAHQERRKGDWGGVMLGVYKPLDHTILGDRGNGDTPNGSDGMVAYWSSHLTGAQSELVVPGPHGSYALPQTVRELKRIRLNLAAASAPCRVASRTRPERVSRVSDVSAN